MGWTTGSRVVCRGNHAWGLGHVLVTDGGNRATVFFRARGRCTLDTAIAVLDPVSGPAAQDPILDVAARVDWQRATRSVYVVELTPEIWAAEARFRAANPAAGAGAACLYVGMTGLTPEERFQKHTRGEKAAWFVRRYGRQLRPDLYRHFNPLPYDLATCMEPELARQLRARGCAVWQH